MGSVYLISCGCCDSLGLLRFSFCVAGGLFGLVDGIAGYGGFGGLFRLFGWLLGFCCAVCFLWIGMIWF